MYQSSVSVFHAVIQIFFLLAQVHDYEYELLPYTTGNRIPALVPTATDRMQILLQSAASQKPTAPYSIDRRLYL